MPDHLAWHFLADTGMMRDGRPAPPDGEAKLRAILEAAWEVTTSELPSTCPFCEVENEYHGYGCPLATLREAMNDD